MPINIPAERVKATLEAILHITNGFSSAVACKEDNDCISHDLIKDMQKAINEEWSRLEQGQPTLLQQNHSQTYPEPGEAPFCGNKPECNNAEGCDTCQEFSIWLDEITDR